MPCCRHCFQNCSCRAWGVRGPCNWHSPCLLLMLFCLDTARLPTVVLGALAIVIIQSSARPTHAVLSKSDTGAASNTCKCTLLATMPSSSCLLLYNSIHMKSLRTGAEALILTQSSISFIDNTNSRWTPVPLPAVVSGQQAWQGASYLHKLGSSGWPGLLS